LSEFKCPHCGAILTVTAKPPEATATGPIEPEAKARPINEIQKLFPAELQEHLSFEQQNSNVIITPHHYLGTENFVKISTIVVDAGGEYISAGKNSHFNIPLKP